MTTYDSEGGTFGFRERLGIVFIAESAGLSALAVTSCLLYILFYAIKRTGDRKWSGSTHIHYYFINLLLCDLIQALGGLLNIRWIIEAKVTEDALCTSQGVLKQLGNVGVALTSLTIAIHTFNTLVLRYHASRKVAIFVLMLIWIFLALIVGIGVAVHGKDDYYGNTQYWCWITQDYPGERIGLEYCWMWLSALVNLICYVFIALVVKGIIVFDNGRLRRRRPDDEARMKVPSKGDGKANAIAMQMLFYPAVYIITVTPIAVSRWISFSGRSVPFIAMCFSSIVFSASGLLHVILFTLTRPRLLPTKEDTFTSPSHTSRILSATRVDREPLSIQVWKESTVSSGPEKYYPARF